MWLFHVLSEDDYEGWSGVLGHVIAYPEAIIQT